MSNELLTGRQRVIVEALGRQWLEGHRDGFNQAAVILTDLITELREAHHSEPYALTDGHYCPTCQTRASRMSDKPVDWPCDTASMADRAEARLREAGFDE